MLWNVTMKSPLTRVSGGARSVVVALVWLAPTLALAQLNSWTNGTGKWEDGVNWSTGTAPGSNHVVFITNALTKTVLLDAVTPAANRIITNLTLTAPVGTTNTLSLANAGVPPLTIAFALSVGPGGSLVITNSALVVAEYGSSTARSNGLNGLIAIQAGGSYLATSSTTAVGSTSNVTARLDIAGGSLVASNLTVAVASNSVGTLVLDGGELVVTGAAPVVVVGRFGQGQLAIANGTARLRTLFLGSHAGGAGTLTVNGGTLTLAGDLTAGVNSTATGTVWIAGGTVLLTNNTLSAGGQGMGAVRITNGGVQCRDLYVGTSPSSRGTFTMNGGAVTVFRNFIVGGSTNAAAAAWLTGGELTLTNDISYLGAVAPAQMTISGGVLRASHLLVGGPGGGTLTLLGGTVEVQSNLYIGLDCGFTGTVAVAGGGLAVTNAAGTAVCDVGGGTLRVEAGVVAINTLVITNACGRFIRAGGALSITATNLASGFDADADGLPNAFDVDPFDPTDVGADSDGDGQSNLAELQAGTSPTNSASFFGITSITPVTNSVVVTWLTRAGKTNALERSEGALTNYVAIFTATNTVAGTTNYTDTGAASLSNAFYRVRLVP